MRLNLLLSCKHSTKDVVDMSPRREASRNAKEPLARKLKALFGSTFSHFYFSLLTILYPIRSYATYQKVNEGGEKEHNRYIFLVL